MMKKGWFPASREQAEERGRRMYPGDLQSAAEVQLAVGVFPEALGDVFLEMAGRDYAAHLKTSASTTFLLNGELDKKSRRGEEGFLKTYPLVKLKVIPGAGHAVSLDQPALYNNAVRGILQGVSTARPTI
jgi:pimeloyl-ACP methyl ester carboxylesterase